MHFNYSIRLITEWINKNFIYIGLVFIYIHYPLKNGDIH